MPHYNIDEIKSAASGQWAAILSSLGGIDAELLTQREKPCPKCGGSTRFSTYADFEKTGSVRCNQCFADRNGDGISALQWLRGWDFKTAIAELAKHLGIKPEKSNSKKQPDPAANLEFREWNEQAAALWCLRKKPIKPAALVSRGKDGNLSEEVASHRNSDMADSAR